jgi:two-component system nitrogen regulation sensor histidine kinase NtrY
MTEDLAESRRALEEAQRRTAAVLRTVATGVVAIGTDETVALANPRAEALLGLPLPAGTPLSMLAPESLVERVRAFTARDVPEEEFELDEEGRQLRGRLAHLRRGGVVLTLDDVTELARAQRVLAWGEMARQVAHEIKNPLTPIRLGVQHLRRAHGDARPDFPAILDENVTRILSEIDRLDEIARAFSRYGTPRAERAPATAVDVAAVVRDVIALEKMGAASVSWRAEGVERPAWALAQVPDLREVLLNLLENARAAQSHGVSVRVERAGREIFIRVRDDGDGISADVLPRIFEPQFSTTTSGSGLGLAISRRMVEGWGGTITVESARGAGTTVTVALAATLAPGELPG